MGRLKFVREPPHVGEAREIGESDLDTIRPGALGHEPPRSLGPSAIAAGHDNLHAAAGQTERGMKADA